MNPVPNRVVIYPKDVANMTGLRQRASRRLLSAIRSKLGKPPTTFVTASEFALHTGISEDIVRSFLM